MQALSRRGRGGRGRQAYPDRRGRQAQRGQKLAGQPHPRRGAGDGLRHRRHHARRHRHALYRRRGVLRHHRHRRHPQKARHRAAVARALQRGARPCRHRPLRRGAPAHRRHAGRHRAGYQDRRLHRRAGQGGGRLRQQVGRGGKRDRHHGKVRQGRARTAQVHGLRPGAVHLRQDRPADAARAGQRALRLRRGHPPRDHGRSQRRHGRRAGGAAAPGHLGPPPQDLLCHAAGRAAAHVRAFCQRYGTDALFLRALSGKPVPQVVRL